MKSTIELTTKSRLRRGFYAVALVGGVTWAGYWLSPTSENIIPNVKPNIVFNNSCIDCEDTATSTGIDTSTGMDSDTNTSTEDPGTDTGEDTSTGTEDEGESDAGADTDTGTG